MRVRPGPRPAALNAFFDTSALLKLLLREPGSDEAARLWQAADRTAASRITYPEARAALAAARRMRRVSPGGLRTAVDALEQRWRQLMIVELDADLARLAGDLAELRTLRGHDAVQLASGLALGADFTFGTWDRELAAAARSAGVTTFPL